MTRIRVQQSLFCWLQRSTKLICSRLQKSTNQFVAVYKLVTEDLPLWYIKVQATSIAKTYKQFAAELACTKACFDGYKDLQIPLYRCVQQSTKQFVDVYKPVTEMLS